MQTHHEEDIDFPPDPPPPQERLMPEASSYILMPCPHCRCTDVRARESNAGTFRIRCECCGSCGPISGEEGAAAVRWNEFALLVRDGLESRRTLIDLRVQAVNAADDRGASLFGVVRDLYRSEINCDVCTFFDSGMRVRIGDSLNGHENIEHFAIDDEREAAAWLRQQAILFYPNSDFARGAKP